MFCVHFLVINTARVILVISTMIRPVIHNLSCLVRPNLSIPSIPTNRFAMMTASKGDHSFNVWVTGGNHAHVLIAVCKCEQICACIYIYINLWRSATLPPKEYITCWRTCLKRCYIHTMSGRTCENLANENVPVWILCQMVLNCIIWWNTYLDICLDAISIHRSLPLFRLPTVLNRFCLLEALCKGRPTTLVGVPRSRKQNKKLRW